MGEHITRNRLAAIKDMARGSIEFGGNNGAAVQLTAGTVLDMAAEIESSWQRIAELEIELSKSAAASEVTTEGTE